MRRIRGGKPQRFGFFWTLVEETETRTDGGFFGREEESGL